MLNAVLFSSFVLSFSLGHVTAPPRSEKPQETRVTTAAPLPVSGNQFHDPDTGLPSWLVQLEVMPAAGREPQLERSIDAVLNDTIGGGRVTHRYTHALVGFAASMTPGEASLLLEDARVRAVEPDLVYSGEGGRSGAADDGDPNLPAPWGLRRISDPEGLAPDFDPCGADGSGVTVAIIDSGITPDHTEFGDRIVAAVNFYSLADSAVDQHGHGTHVASTVAGTNVGVAPAADIVALRALGPDNSGPLAGIIAALNWLANPFNIQPPATVNMSLQGPTFESTSFIYFDALQSVVQRGIPIIACAGNYSYPSSWSIPGNSADAVCVGATNILDQIAVFSNNGPDIDLWAPGVNILAADWRYPDGGLMLDSGTSMASPMTTGVMALHLQRHPPTGVTGLPGLGWYETLRKRLSLIAATTSNRLHDQMNPDLVAVGGNGAMAGGANRLLQACPAVDVAGCESFVDWNGSTASIVLGDGVEPLTPGFNCSTVVTHPQGTVALQVLVPSVVPAIESDGSFSQLAAQIVVTDLATNQVVWVVSESYITASPIDRAVGSLIQATGPEGLRIDWVSIRDDLSGGFGYAMTAIAIGVVAGDFNGDGVVDGPDLGQLLVHWGPCAGNPCIGDLDEDGVVDAADLGLLLAAWGPTIESGFPGFIKDCNGNLAPAAWLGDQKLDDGTRGFVLSPLANPAAQVAVNLDCEALNWDSPTVGTSVSPSDPRMGAAVLPDGTCIEATLMEATSQGGVFLGHGTACDQLLPSVGVSDFYPEGARAYGDYVGVTNGANLNAAKSPGLVKQPIDGDLRSVGRLVIHGIIQALAPSNSNLNSVQYQHNLASFTSDFKVTLAFRDGSDPVSVTRSPGEGMITGSNSFGSLRRYVIDDVHVDDGRAIESISIQAAFDGPGLPSRTWAFLDSNEIEDEDPSPGALASWDGGQTWHPFVAADGRRLQLVLGIVP